MRRWRRTSPGLNRHRTGIKIDMSDCRCPLCRREIEIGQLRKSHFIPRALYHSGKSDLQFATRSSSGKIKRHISDLLLCNACERRLDENGESEVLLHIAPKAGKRFPLHEKLRLALPREAFSDLQRFAGNDLGIDMDKFAYFALSMVWRAAVHDWEMPDGSILPRMAIGNFEPPIREYLLGEAFPPDTAVIVVVCSDAEARKVWTTPTVLVEADCLNFRFLLRGIFFRVMMGYRMWSSFREACCASPRKCLFYGSAAHRMPEILEIFDN
jgi:hypothetical protein